MSECRLLTKRLHRDVPRLDLPLRNQNQPTSGRLDVTATEPRSLSVRIGCDRYGERFARSHIRHRSHLVVENLHKILLRKGGGGNYRGAHQRRREPSVANYRVVWSNYLSAFNRQSNQQRKIRRDSELEPLVCTSSAYHLSLSGVEN